FSRADDLAYWRGDGGPVVAIERAGEIAAFAYRRGDRIGPAAGRDETAFLPAVAAAAGAGRDGDKRRPGMCRCPAQPPGRGRVRVGELAVFMASRLFGRPELYLPSGPILY